MSDVLTFAVDGTESARAEVATMLATRHADTWQLRYARWRSVMAMVGAGIVALIVLVAIVRVLTGGPPNIWLGLAASLGGAWAWRALAFASVRRMTAGLAETSPLMDGRQVWTFTPEGVRIVSDVADSTFGWRAFDRVLEGQSAVGFASGNVYFALPLDDAEARAELLERVEAWMVK